MVGIARTTKDNAGFTGTGQVTRLKPEWCQIVKKGEN